MTTLHQQRRTDPESSRRSITTRRPVVVGMAVVAGLVALAIALLVRGDHGATFAGSVPVRGSGVAVSETRTLPSFTAVELAGSMEVSVRIGAPVSVVVHADDNLLGHVRTSVRSGALVIETTGSFSARAPMSVSVVVPSLTGVTLSGSGNLVVDGVDASSFTASLPGSGTMHVAGRTQQLDVSLPGSGQMSMSGLIARSVQAQLSGSGQILVHATDSLDAEVSGSGSVRYAGSPPQVTSAVTGSGTVQPE